MQSLLLYGHPDSGHAIKVALALRLAGLAHECRRIEIWEPADSRPADFRARSPFAEVPLLVWGDENLVQSANILHVIAERTGTLGGDSPARLSKVREILFWEANRIGMCLPQLIEARRPGADPFPPGAVEWLRMRHAVDRARFDRLIGDKPFLLGDGPTVADCAVFGYAQWHDRARVDPTPRLEAWLGRMRDLAGDGDWFPAA